jgi:hypothetical protein
MQIDAAKFKPLIETEKTSPKDKQPVSLLWQPRAHSLPVPSKACQTSITSCGTPQELENKNIQSQ